ncbi:hypothetical protein HDU84_009484 [Entophlyctis sp. JEL0112]|nr:hypothetical protein HDU84_009484 [Entophlyctis sp. JEL0112]
MAFEHFNKGIDSGPSKYLDFLVIAYCQKRGFHAFRPKPAEPVAEGFTILPNGLVTNLDSTAAQLLWNGHDSLLFEQLLNSGETTVNTEASQDSVGNDPTPLEQLRNLIINEQFLPIVEYNPTSLFRIFQLSQMNLDLLDVMIRSNGFKVSKVNDDVLRRVIATTAVLEEQTPTAPTRGLSSSSLVMLSSDAVNPPVPQTSFKIQSSSTMPLSAYLARGFRITPKLIRSILLDNRTTKTNGSKNSTANFVSAAMKTLEAHGTARRLIVQVVREIAWEMFGPQDSISFNAGLVDQFVDTGMLSEADVQRVLMGTLTQNPSSPIVDGEMPLKAGNNRRRSTVEVGGVPYATRCFEKKHPQEVWLWVLGRFGGSHVFSQYCFDDLLQWLGDLSVRADRSFLGISGKRRLAGNSNSNSNPNLSAMGDASFNPFSAYVSPFLEAGVTVLPRHVQFLSKAARCKYAAPMPAMVLSMALRKLVQKRDMAIDALEAVELESRRRQLDSNADEKYSSPFRRAKSRSRSRSRVAHKRGVSRDGFRSKDSSATTVEISGNLAASSDLGPQGFSKESSALLAIEEECAVWYEALRGMFADYVTVREIKKADAEWLKEFKADLDQERKDIASIGLPVKKSWSGGGLGNRSTDPGFGWWDFLTGIGGSAMKSRVKALGNRNLGRPARFLEVAEEMISKLNKRASVQNYKQVAMDLNSLLLDQDLDDSSFANLGYDRVPITAEVPPTSVLDGHGHLRKLQQHWQHQQMQQQELYPEAFLGNCVNGSQMLGYALGQPTPNFLLETLCHPGDSSGSDLGASSVPSIEDAAVPPPKHTFPVESTAPEQTGDRSHESAIPISKKGPFVCTTCGSLFKTKKACNQEKYAD